MKLRRRPTKLDLNHPHEQMIAPIIADGAIASPIVGDGRLIPLVILDTSARPDIDAAIEAHVDAPPGDVRAQWGFRDGNADKVVLLLRFERPAELAVIVEFELAKNHGVLVEGVLAGRGLYIQAGRPGDRLKDDVNKPKILAEVRETGFSNTWRRVYRDFTTRRMRDLGVPRANARKAADEAIAMARGFAHLRFNPTSD